MPFISLPEAKTVLASGPSDAKIAIVGEAPGATEDNSGVPFSGPSGKVLEGCLHGAGLTRSEVYVTNLVKTRPPANNISSYFTDKGGLSQKGRDCADAMADELASVNPNVIVPMGNVALCALTGKRNISKVRGYITESTLLPGKKVIPTMHPAFTIYRGGNYIARYYITHDLKKAASESDSPQIIWPDRKLITQMDFAEALAWCDFYRQQPVVAFDIEVIQYQVSCISFCSDPDTAVSIPLYNKWDLRQECEIWKRIAGILEDPSITKVGQNLIFDNQFLAQQCGIFVQGPIYDTMIAHHIMYPDMLKGLGFLASIYTRDAYWKDMVDFKNIKKEN